jgi:predicted dehydrogenase
MGVIGAGMAFERLHYPAYQELAQQYELGAICDVDRNKASEWAGRLGLTDRDVYADYREMLDRPDLDAFDIMVPIGENHEVTEVVARAGKPIICEKPLAPSLAQALAQRDLARRFGVPIMIAENYRYNEEINMIRDMVMEKKVGEPVYFIHNRVVDFSQDMLGDKFAAREWRQHPEFPGGIILDTAVHDLAALRHIFGAVDRLHAFGQPSNRDFAPYRVANANVRFKNGVTGQFTFYCTGQEAQRPLVGLRIFCERGTIFLEERDCGFVNIAYNDGGHEAIPYRPRRGYYNELLNFYNAAVGKEMIAVTPEVEFGDARMLFAILKSVREEAIITVDNDEAYQIGYARERIPAAVH